ncbi:MAG: hypothetical protein QM820_55590 [Minicystis sp.]
MRWHIAPGTLASIYLAAMLSGCTPEQGQAVPITQLFTDAKLHGKHAAVTGTLGISTGIMGSTSCKAGRCKLQLGVPDPGWKPPKDTVGTVTIEVSTGSGENEMAELPEKYAKTDVKVKAMGGKVIAFGERVKVSGKLHCHGNNGEDRLPCSMSVDRIDTP